MCWKCGSEIKDEIIGRSSVCGVCGKDLHSCRNCGFYSPGSHYDCRETVSDPVSDKERSNFCDSFKVRRIWSGNGNLNTDDKAAAAKKAFDSLFG